MEAGSAVSLGIEGQGQVQAIERQAGTRPLGPFDQDNAVVEGGLEADFIQVFGRFDPVEVEMGDGAEIGVIGLHDGEGRAGHVFLDTGGPQEGPRQFGLAGAEIAMQGDAVPGSRHGGQGTTKRRRPRQVRQVEADVLAVRIRPRADHAWAWHGAI